MPTNRREFLSDVARAAGLVFVGCGVTDAAAPRGQRATGPRRTVAINGRRIRTVDIHAHCAVSTANDLLRRPPSDHGCLTFPDRCTPGVPKLAPTEYVKRMYYDSLVFTPEALRHLVAEVGADHVAMGTDYPFPWVTAPVDHVLNTSTLNDTEKEAVLGATAARLLNL